MTFSSGSSSTRVASELYKMMSGAPALHVPYKGVPQALTDLMGHQVDFMISDINPALPLIQNGKLRAVAVTTSERNPLLGKVPTMAESGLSGYEMTAWVAAFFPPIRQSRRRTHEPADPKRADESGGNRTLQPDRRSTFPIDARRAGRFVRSETAKWAKVIKAAGIEPE